MAAGRVVVLNGPSSAGKTTLAHAVRDAAPATTLVVSIDQLMPSIAPTQPRGWALYAALTEATCAAAVAFADAGYDVVVDTVFERAECVATAQAMLARHEHALVAVTCALDVLEARERARGNRRIGQARGQRERVLHDARYDLVVDTSAMSIAECTAAVAALLRRS